MYWLNIQRGNENDSWMKSIFYTWGIFETIYKSKIENNWLKLWIFIYRKNVIFVKNAKLTKTKTHFFKRFWSKGWEDFENLPQIGNEKCEFWDGNKLKNVTFFCRGQISKMSLRYRKKSWTTFGIIWSLFYQTSTNLISIVLREK